MSVRKRVVRRGPLSRWKSVAHLLRLATVSTMVDNIEAPLNVLLVGPPGDGKTRMLLRLSGAPVVRVLSDTTYVGLVEYLRQVYDDRYSCLVIPDFGTIVGRRVEVGKQTIATMAMMCAEGVYEIRVGKRVADYNGVKSSVLGAITPGSLQKSLDAMDQNAFLSRVLLVNFDLKLSEIEPMVDRKLLRGRRDLLTTFQWREVPKDGKGRWIKRNIRVSKQFAKRALRWWDRVHRERTDRFFAFRTADQLIGFLQASAYMHGRWAVGRADVQFVEDNVVPFMMEQFRLPKEINF